MTVDLSDMVLLENGQWAFHRFELNDWWPSECIRRWRTEAALCLTCCFGKTSQLQSYFMTTVNEPLFIMWNIQILTMAISPSVLVHSQTSILVCNCWPLWKTNLKKKVLLAPWQWIMFGWWVGMFYSKSGLSGGCGCTALLLSPDLFLGTVFITHQLWPKQQSGP